MKGLAVLTACAAGSVLMLSGCVSQDNAQRVLDVLPCRAYHYSPFGSAKALADHPAVKLIASGGVVGFAEGPTYSAERVDDVEAASTVVMSVHVEDVMKGQAPSSGTVYVALEQCDSRERGAAALVEAHSAALPAGTKVGLYLESALVEEDDFPVAHDDAGRPAGEPLWQVGPQAFIVADGDDNGVVLPLLGKIMPQADFEDHLPLDETSTSPSSSSTSHGDPACAFRLEYAEEVDNHQPVANNRSGPAEQNDPNERHYLEPMAHPQCHQVK